LDRSGFISLKSRTTSQYHALLISAAHNAGQAAAEKASAYGLALAIPPKVFTSLHQFVGCC
jgi:hypothetical protein